MATLVIPDSWTPTPENINALPLPLRHYIHDLQTKNAALRKECEALSNKIVEHNHRLG